MAAVLWGNYGRMVARPRNACIVIAVVFAVNVSIILSSKMWAVPLATDISRLWIDPASEVAANNHLVEKYGNKVDGANNELYTLGNKDGSTMLSVDSMNRWARLATAVHDTVVFVNGTAFTVLDICNARFGQSPYSFGCAFNNPLDYFSEGGVFHPEDGSAQWMLDTKLAYKALTDDSPEGRQVMWEWAINADQGSKGMSRVYTTWFNKHCLSTKKLLCGSNQNNTALLNTVNQFITSPDAPRSLKFQLAWTKAQLTVAGLLQSLDGSCTTNGANNVETPSVTQTPAITLSTDAAFLAGMRSYGYVDGQQYSLANCATQAFASGPLSCPTATCSFAALNTLEPFNFASPCSSCILASMFWSGDLFKIDSAVGNAVPSPPGNTIRTTINSNGNTIALNVANSVRVAPNSPCPVNAPTRPELQVNPSITVNDCLTLWDQFAIGTQAGLANNRAAAKETARVRAALLAPKARADLELIKYFTKEEMDTQWREVLKSGLIKESIAAVIRHSERPSFRASSALQIARTLSGSKNDLLTQNLRGAIFGSARPPVAEIKAGKCVCSPDWSGAGCTFKQDNICDCAKDIKPSCISGIIDSCLDLAPCATYPGIKGLLTSPNLPPLPPAIQTKFANFDNEMLVNGAFTVDSTASQDILLEECKAFVPCVDGTPYASQPGWATMAPSSYIGVFGDASWTLSMAGDLTAPSDALRFERRANLLASGCASSYLPNPLNSFCKDALALSSIPYAWSGFNIVGQSDTREFLACFAMPKTITNCKNELLEGNGLPSQLNMATLCPLTFASLAATNVKISYYTFWLCVAEEQQRLPTQQRKAAALTLWPIGQTDTKSGACDDGEVLTIPKDKCISIMGSFILNAINKILPNFLPPNAPVILREPFLPAFGASPGAKLQTFVERGNTVGFFANQLASQPTFLNKIKTNVYNGCTNYTSCTKVSTGIDEALRGECKNLQQPYPFGSQEKFLNKSACLTVFENLGGVLTKDQAQLSVLSQTLAKFKFVATVFGACSQTGGVAQGGDCWDNSDCNSKGQGTCGSLGESVPFAYMEKFAGLILSSSPEAVVNMMNRKDGKYRQLANAPILARYLAKTQASGRRLQAQNFGTLGPIQNMTLEFADTVLKEWRKKMVLNVKAFKMAEGNAAEADVISADSPELLLESVSDADPALLILGYGLMLLYAVIACSTWSSDRQTCFNGSRALVAQGGILLVAVSVASGLGVSHLMKIEWSAAATQIVPFVMLALGVSDVFVLLRVFPTYREGLTAEDAACRAFTTAGPSMFLVSATNAGVFMVGIITGMPVVVNFALQSVIVVIANYLTVNTAFPAMLALDYRRQANGKADLAPCIKVGVSDRNQIASEGEYEQNIFNSSCVPAYNRCLFSIPGMLLTVLSCAAFIFASVYGVEVTSELGLQLSDIAPAGSDLSSALITRDENFAFYTMSIVTAQANWARREVQQGIVKVFDNVMNTTKIIDGSGTPWMKAFMAWGLPPTPGYNPYAEGETCHPSNSKTEGKCGHKVNCVVVTADQSVVDGAIPYYPSADFYRCLNEWINSDLVYEALKPGFKLLDDAAPRGSRHLFLIESPVGSGNWELPFSRGTVITSGLQTNADFVQLINDVRAVANSETTPPTFPIGEPIDFWDQYINLRAIINKAVGFGLLICFLAVFFLMLALVDGEGSSFAKRIACVFWASALCTAVIAATVYELYGFMAFFGIKISAIPAISIIMSTGVAVEFTAYVTYIIVNAPGTRMERAKHSMMIMMAPVIDGAVTMFLGVSMLAASPFLFIVKYFFYPWLLIIFFGFYNGVVVLPVFFALFGPPAVNMADVKRVSQDSTKDLGFRSMA